MLAFVFNLYDYVFMINPIENEPILGMSDALDQDPGDPILQACRLAASILQSFGDIRKIKLNPLVGPPISPGFDYEFIETAVATTEVDKISWSYSLSQVGVVLVDESPYAQPQGYVYLFIDGKNHKSSKNTYAQQLVFRQETHDNGPAIIKTAFDQEVETYSVEGIDVSDQAEDVRMYLEYIQGIMWSKLVAADGLNSSIMAKLPAVVMNE